MVCFEQSHDFNARGMAPIVEMLTDSKSDQVLVNGGPHSGSACRPDVTDVSFSRAAQTVVTGRTMRKASVPFHPAPFAKFGAVVGATPDLPTVGTLAIRTFRKLSHPATSCRSRGWLCGGIKCASSEATPRLALPMQLGNATGRKGTSLVRPCGGDSPPDKASNVSRASSRG